ncbi:ATP-binding protein [Mucilaginibacter sabulilitoris]|uniref:histidine kinase n=1 Tax=Mucilaginibacter sabulilitoris TaxID=1173583 RepID=A0ABZ0TIT7_9SPHI|nr:ATP-binding protein [Mucilaginibacter sabulilitoris]WPU92862.1 ATP-binding protein [Mucilaginibacter sabulilitoris]
MIAETDRQRVIDAISSAMSFESGGRYDIEYTILNPELQEPRLVKAKGRALFTEQQEVKRFSGTLQDVTGERNAMQELKDANKKLEMALEQSRLSKTAAQLGTFDLDLVNGTMEWDERCRMLFGITHQDRVSYGHDFLTGLHPEDRDRVSKVIENLYNRPVSKGDYDIEYRTIGATDGKLRWIRAIGKVFFNTEDVAVRFIGSVLDITDRKLEELRKDDFISIVSHELKTPLTTLSAMIQLLKLKFEHDTEALIPGGIDKAYGQIKKMNVLINSFLDVARFQSGKIDMDCNHFYISELVKEMVDQVVFTANRTHLIDITLCEEILVYADREKIGSVLLNILSNATKFSTQGRSIEIRCYKEGDEVKISVRDEGYGISLADQEHLFEKFYRVRNKFTTNTSGFGIGLYLCRQVMDDHNGRIQVESIEGKGSTFLLTLPTATIPIISHGSN